MPDAVVTLDKVGDGGKSIPDIHRSGSYPLSVPLVLGIWVGARGSGSRASRRARSRAIFGQIT